MTANDLTLYKFKMQTHQSEMIIYKSETLHLWIMTESQIAKSIDGTSCCERIEEQRARHVV